MLESLYLAVRVVIPLIVYMGIGGAIRYKGLVTSKTIKEMNDVVFKVLLSTMIFYNIYTADLKQDFEWKLLVYAICSLLILVVFLCIVLPLKISDRAIAPVMIQGIYRSNFVLFGLQVTASICGNENLGMTTLLISIIIPMFNVIAVILFETYRSEKVNVGNLLVGIIKNPLIIASVLGLITLALRIRFGDLTYNLLRTISQMATPMSLILLGGTVSIAGIKKYWKYTLVASVARLFIVPFVFLSLAVAFGFRGAGLVALMVMYGSPTAVSSFPMASSMGGNGELAGQIVAATTVLSVISIFLWTYILSINGWIG